MLANWWFQPFRRTLCGVEANRDEGRESRALTFRRTLCGVEATGASTHSANWFLSDEPFVGLKPFDEDFDPDAFDFQTNPLWG